MALSSEGLDFVGPNLPPGLKPLGLKINDVREGNGGSSKLGKALSFGCTVDAVYALLVMSPL